MRSYDPGAPLVFIHIPRCGGTSLSAILKKWYGSGFLTHYYLQEEGRMPTRHEERPGTCIYGHFNRDRGFGTEDYYPDAVQFATFLRNPLELALSTYFHWKNKRRDIRIRTGKLEPGSDDGGMPSAGVAPKEVGGATVAVATRSSNPSGDSPSKGGCKVRMA